MNYRNPADDARASGDNDQEGFLNPEANWRALKKLAIEVPLGMVVEGVITVVGIAVVIVLIRGCA